MNKNELNINGLDTESKMTIAKAVLKRMNNDETLFNQVYDTTFQSLKDDSIELDCFIYDLNKCCLHAETMNPIESMNNNDELYIMVVTVDSIEYIVSFLD